MAAAVFFVHGKFCHGLAQFREEEYGIIAESVRAAIFGDDLAFAGAFGKLHVPVRYCNRNRGAEAGRPRARSGLYLTYEVQASFSIG